MKKVMVICLALTVTTTALAMIDYDNTSNIIRVTDYPEAVPCSLHNIFSVDKMNGWNKITYDSETNTYTVNAHLYIGNDDGSTTYFKIGDPKHQKTMLVMHGNLVVCPDAAPISKGVKHETFVKKTWKGINSLTIGSAENKNIKTIIKFYPDHGLLVGAERRPYSGEIFMYNTTIEPYKANTKIGVNGCLRMIARKVVIDSCKFIGFRKGLSAIHGGGWDHMIKNTTFENCGVGMAWYWDARNFQHPLIGLKFINCDIAIDTFYNHVLMENCVFENNKHNWNIKKNLKKIIFKNCRLGKPLDGNIGSPDKSVITVLNEH